MQSVLSSTFHTLHLNYIRNSRAIAVLWCVFTICFTIINIVVFLQPWLGDSVDAENKGYFGLFESCRYYSRAKLNYQEKFQTFEYRLMCDGAWSSLTTALSPVATFAIGSSAIINLICIACFLVLFLFLNPSIVFSICGTLQLISTFFMILGCIIYPYSWDDPQIMDVCETSTRYYSGKCRIKWAYILAIIGIFDIFFLAILALVLSKRQANNYKIASTISYVHGSNKNLTSIGNPAMNMSESDLRSKFDTASFRDFQI